MRNSTHSLVNEKFNDRLDLMRERVFILADIIRLRMLLVGLPVVILALYMRRFPSIRRSVIVSWTSLLSDTGFMNIMLDWFIFTGRCIALFVSPQFVCLIA